MRIFVEWYVIILWNGNMIVKKWLKVMVVSDRMDIFIDICWMNVINL